MKRLFLLLFACVAVVGQITNVNIGTNPNDKTGDTLRTAFSKVNTNTAWLSSQLGYATNTGTKLKAWARAGAYTVSSASYSSSGVLTNATVVWPDSSSGVFTATVNSTFQSIDAFTITYVGATTNTVTQSAVTRNSNGQVTSTPSISVE